MVKKSKGRQKIEMVKMKNESNLQVTFSKRRAGLFKKASELCTLCAAEIVIIVFSPGRKVFSFGHPNVETIIDRFLNNNARPLHQHNNIHLNEAHRNTLIQDLNALLTEQVNQFDLEKKRNEDIKKIRAQTKALGHWWENPIETLDLDHLYAYKTHLENLKNAVSLAASKFFQVAVPNFYVGSSSNAAFGIDGGTNFNHNLDLSNQRRMVDVNGFNFNQNQIHPNHQLQFGNSPHGSISQGFLPDFNMNYRPEFNPNQIQHHNQNQIFKREDFSGYEHHQHGHYPPHSGPGHF